MSTDIAIPGAAPAVALYEDPTGGRLVAWAGAAVAANSLAKSLCKTEFVPRGLDVDNATARVLMGDELGLSPLAALRSIYVVHGTPALYARTMVALTLSKGHEVWTESTSDSKVVVCGRRRGSEHIEKSEWTMDRAKRAGYTSNAKYASTPQEMLYSKAAGEVCRKIAADVLAGIPYTVEDLELEESAPKSETVTRSEPAAKSTKVKRNAAPDPVEPPLDDAVIFDAELVDAIEELPTPPADSISPAQLKMLGALMNELHITERADALKYVGDVVGRDIESRNDLTKSEASKVIEALTADKGAQSEPGFDNGDPTFPGGA